MKNGRKQNCADAGVHTGCQGHWRTQTLYLCRVAVVGLSSWKASYIPIGLKLEMVTLRGCTQLRVRCVCAARALGVRISQARLTVFTNPWLNFSINHIFKSGWFVILPANILSGIWSGGLWSRPCTVLRRRQDRGREYFTTSQSYCLLKLAEGFNSRVLLLLVEFNFFFFKTP